MNAIPSYARSVEIRGVSKSFYSDARGEVKPVDNVSLFCPQGELTCILGPSGCGKTTLLRLVAGLIQPDAGDIYIGDFPVSSSDGGVAMVSQSGDLLPWRTVIDNVAFGLELRGEKKAVRYQKATEAIGKIGLPLDVCNGYPHELSGGMRQRVALARALCFEAPVMLMDEPFASLDEPTRHYLQDKLIELHQTTQTTTLFVTHSIEEAIFLADKIVIFAEGKVLANYEIDQPHPRDRFSRKFIDRLLEIRRVLADGQLCLEID